MTTLDPVQASALAALAGERAGIESAELAQRLRAAGVADGEAGAAAAVLVSRGFASAPHGVLQLSPAGMAALLDFHAAVTAALDPSPARPGEESCPSVPWLTTVQTCWIDAVSINYAVDPDILARELPPPLEPEIHKGTAWMQVLMSSLREMRPQGMPSLFGVNFYQVSYRAAVTCRGRDGRTRRGGYFVRSETNDEVMRAVGNRLAEFKYHDFGAAEMVMLRDGDRLTVGVDPSVEGGHPGGKLVGIFDTRPQEAPPPGSAWASLDDLEGPLVHCYDAFGVDPSGPWLYILTIDRGPWNARFVHAEQLYCELVETGAYAGAARLDSVLHIRECPYRWRPLRRERLA